MENFLDCVKQMHIDKSPIFREYRCKDGVLRGNVEGETNNLLIHYVEVYSDKQRKGIFKSFLTEITNVTSPFTTICFLGVQSYILDEYLTRFQSEGGKQFECVGGDFIIRLK